MTRVYMSGAFIASTRTQGEILWKRIAHRGVPKIKRHPKATHANCTPATNGKYVVAFFGSEGLFCYNMDGTPLWKRGLGTLDSGFLLLAGGAMGFRQLTRDP